MPLYGHELSESIDPYQAGLAFAVNLEGRTFVGHDALQRLSQQPPARQRVGLALSGKRVPREQYTVLSAGRPVGQVTSGTFSPTLQRPIAMAYVERDHAQAGETVTVDIRGQGEPAVVVNLPFYARSR